MRRLLRLIPSKEFLNANWWYFVGPPPAEGGRRPRAEAAASPQGWPPPKTSLFIQKVFDCKWYKTQVIPPYKYGLGGSLGGKGKVPGIPNSGNSFRKG